MCENGLDASRTKSLVSFGIYKVRLPSGTETKPPKTDQLAITHDGAGQATVQQSASETDRAVRRLEMALNESYPGGVQQIAVKDVVSDASIQDYQVLPREAGLLRLIQDGTLEVVGVDNFKIARKMRYPGGLTRLNRSVSR